MTNDTPYGGEQINSFVELLKQDLPDRRDNRGKRHSLVFVIVGFVLATPMGRQKVSGIRRFVADHADWLGKPVQDGTAKPVSRAHLPRLPDGPDWAALDEFIERSSDVRMRRDERQGWAAVGGKALRGTLDAGDKQNLILAVAHDTREAVAQARQRGDKSSEIPAVRALLKDGGLERQKAPLDARHLNPATMAQIHQAGGLCPTQAKASQAASLRQRRTLRAESPALAETAGRGKTNGRATTRRARLFPLASPTLGPRREGSGLPAPVAVERETFTVSTRKTTAETSYYVGNPVADPAAKPLAEELAQAIRRHWGAESNNWIRDAAFKEDGVKTRAGNQAQVMGLLRGLAHRVDPQNAAEKLSSRHRKVCGFNPRPGINAFASEIFMRKPWVLEHMA